MCLTLRNMCLTLRKSIKFTSRIRLFCKKREHKNRFFIFKIVFLQATLNFFMKKENLFPDYIFESSWEVCNKVGGIYTVLSTRAKTLVEQLGDKLIFIGPDCWGEKTSPYFAEDDKRFVEKEGRERRLESKDRQMDGAGQSGSHTRRLQSVLC